MKLRGQSQLGWGLLQMLGEQSLPFVTTDAQKRDEARRVLLAGRKSGKRAALERAAAKAEPVRAELVPEIPEPPPPACFTIVYYRCGHIYRKWATDTPEEKKLDHDCAECAVPIPGEVTYAATLEDQFCEKLKACHCAAPGRAMGEMRWVLQCFASRDTGAVPMLALYYLDARGLIEHGLSLHAGWLTKEGEELLEWLRAERVDPIPFGQDPDGPFHNWLRCECSRLVPRSEWVEPQGICEDCYQALSEDWRAAMRENDRDRLIGETVD